MSQTGDIDPLMHKKHYLRVLDFAFIIPGKMYLQKNKWTTSKVIGGMLIFMISIVVPLLSFPVAQALIEEPCPDGFMARFNPGQSPSYSEICESHQTGGPEPDLLEVQRSGTPDPSQGATLDADCKPPTGQPLTSSNCGIIGYIVTIINVLSGLVGIVIVIMIAVGGLQYSMARDDPQAVSAAKNRIKNAVMALVFYLFGFAFLQWLIPGGLF